MTTIFTLKERREYDAWLAEKAAIKRAEPADRETEAERQSRIKKLLADFPLFSKYYFGHLIDSDFAYFHKRDTKYVLDHPDCFALFEWPREHAKSIIVDVMLPMMLKAREELSGMMISSANQDKANTLLADIQAELMFNRRYVSDFGEQYSQGAWKDGHFMTKDGCGFWAFGRGQSPRGVRKAEKRPNYGVFDDIEDATLNRNEERVREVTDWILGDFYGAMPIKGSRLIGAGNRTHKKGVVAHIVGDIEPDDPKREGLYHSKVFALENPRTRQKDLSEKGVPAWKERYSYGMIVGKMRKMGWRIGLREFFHEHIVEGRIFRDEHLPWATLPPIQQCEKVVTYNDPSYKGNKTSDYKAIVLVGRNGRYFDIYDCFVRQCTTGEMVRGHYNLSEQIPANVPARHYMEAGFIQDTMLENYDTEGDSRGYYLAIRPDRRHKPDKGARIENLTPYAERGFIRFNQAMKQNPDMQVLRDQFLGFPDAEHDDAPDAVEGAIYLLNKGNVRSSQRGKRENMKVGKFNRNTEHDMY